MTNWTVTLKQLRKAEACIEGYNKLVCALSGKTFNAERETYIRFKHDEPISIAHILESNGFYDALWATQCVAGADRDLRLFAVWCARQVQHLMADERSITALDVAEKFANGQASEAELDAAWDAAWDAAGDAAGDAAWDAARAAARDAACAAARDAAWDAARDAAGDAAWGAAWDAARAAARDAAWDAARAAAWAAAWDAAMDAVWAAARDAAWGAARDAARDAARAAQREMFVRMLNGTAPWQVED